MKKMIVSAFMLTMFATTYANQNVVTSSAKATSVAEDNEKTKIEVSALPEAVKTTLGTEAYKGWQATNAWLVKGNPEYYEVELQSGDKKNTVKLDKDGKVK